MEMESRVALTYKIRDEAKKDRRLPSLWLLLRLVELDQNDVLIPDDESEEESVNVKAGK